MPSYIGYCLGLLPIEVTCVIVTTGNTTTTCSTTCRLFCHFIFGHEFCCQFLHQRMSISIIISIIGHEFCWSGRNFEVFITTGIKWYSTTSFLLCFIRWWTRTSLLYCHRLLLMYRYVWCCFLLGVRLPNRTVSAWLFLSLSFSLSLSLFVCVSLSNEQNPTVDGVLLYNRCLTSGWRDKTGVIIPYLYCIMSTVLLFQYYFYCGNAVVVVVVVELTTSRFSSSSFDIYCLLLSFGIFSYSNYEQIRPDRWWRLLMYYLYILAAWICSVHYLIAEVGAVST